MDVDLDVGAGMDMEAEVVDVEAGSDMEAYGEVDIDVEGDGDGTTEDEIDIDRQPIAGPSNHHSSHNARYASTSSDVHWRHERGVGGKRKEKRAKVGEVASAFRASHPLRAHMSPEITVTVSPATVSPSLRKGKGKAREDVVYSAAWEGGLNSEGEWSDCAVGGVTGKLSTFRVTSCAYGMLSINCHRPRRTSRKKSAP